MKIMKDKEIALVKEILRKLGASEEDCELVAEATIDAETVQIGRASCRERV